VTDRVAIVGGGIAGLSVAHRLLQRGIEPVVFEADGRAGGKLRSTMVGGLLVEAGADSFVARKPWAVELCRELGVPLAAPGAGGAYVWAETGLVRYLRDAPFGIPGDVGDVLRWPGLSRAGRGRAARDLVLAKQKDGAEESLGALLRRRLGDEATDRSIAPLLAGLHAGDVDKLSALATFPELVEWEAAQGSLIRGSQAARRAAAGSQPEAMFLRPRGGVERLTDALSDALGDRVRVDAPVASLNEIGDPDAIVLATPAFEAARLVRDLSSPASAELAAITYASTGVVFLVYPEGTQEGLPAGTGFVVPRGMAPMSACTWLSSKWPDEAYGTRAVLRCYVGGAGDEDVLEADDADLIDACARHVAAVVALPEHAEHAAVYRWPSAMPQYELGHLERVRRIRGSLPTGIFVVGNAYDGVGIPDAVRGAGEIADAVAALLSGAWRTDEEFVR
jgi:protoporphyrinogen/coproporphyrinogen III oxidase